MAATSGTSQDVAVLTRKLGAVDYDPVKYVSEISQGCVGGEDVVQKRKVIQSLVTLGEYQAQPAEREQ